MPAYGTINLHASLLPQYRGAAPINWAIINWEIKTGITTFFIEEQIDTGKIILQSGVPVLPSDNAGSLHDKLMKEGAQLLNRSIDRIIAGDYSATEQTQLVHEKGTLHPAPKITREMCRIDWNQPLEYIHNFVRGMSPYPAAWTEFSDGVSFVSPVKILSASAEKSLSVLKPRKIVTDGKTWLKVSHREGYLNILTLQFPGKKQLPVHEFLKGYRFGKNPEVS